MTTYPIIDTPWHTTNQLDCLKSSGIEVVIRYYNNGNSATLPQKRLELPEAQALSNDGFQIMVVYQTTQNSVSSFSEQKGYDAGVNAFNWAKNTIGQPRGSAIYFAVDYNATQSEIDNNIAPYFQGVKTAFEELSALGERYNVGAYGSGLVVNSLLEMKLIDYRWLSMSTGYRGTTEAIENGDYELRQIYPSQTLCSIAVDFDEKKSPETNIGSWSLRAASESAS